MKVPLFVSGLVIGLACGLVVGWMLGVMFGPYLLVIFDRRTNAPNHSVRGLRCWQG